MGSYVYGAGLQAGGSSPSPLHAATSLTSGYSATYDASGNMVCRAPNSTITCAGSSPTGQQLGYDAAGRLASWQNQPGASPNVAIQYGYDGAGTRVAQHVLSFGSAWTTAYLLGDTAETVEGSGTFTDYLAIPGVGTVVETNSPTTPTLSYLVTDGLQSVSVALDALGNVMGQALYFPYGIGRYFTGRFPTTHGFTGQDQDGNATGLFYDHARYYDPAIGQFASADSYDGGGLNRFAYVKDNPETRNDPSGHCWPLCAVIAAVVTAVVVTTAQAAIQYVTTGQVDWGSDLKTGVTAGVLVGATLLAGPAVELAGGAIAGVVSGGATALGASAAAGEVAGTVVAGGIMGAGEGLVQGAIAGDRGGDLLADAGIGALSGGIGGALGSFAGRLGRMGRILGREEAGARIAGMVSNGSANAVSQGFQIARGRQTGFDMGSLAISAGAGWGWGKAVSSDRTTFRSFQQHPFLTAASFAGVDAAAQATYAFVTGRIGVNYSSGDIVVHSRHVW